MAVRTTPVPAHFAFRKASIFPQHGPYALAGFTHRMSAHNQLGVGDIFARVLWLSTNGQNLLFITLDTLYFPAQVRDAALGILRSHGVFEQNVVFNASHTHSAPSVAVASLGAINNHYLQFLQDTVCALLTSAAQALAPCILTAGWANVPGLCINRRRLGLDMRSAFLKRRVLMLPNPSGWVNDRAWVLRIASPSNALLGLVFSLACHPVFNINRNISSDFPGAVVERLERDLGCFGVFLQGFSAEVRPNFTTRWPAHPVLLLKALFNGPVFPRYCAAHFQTFVNRLVTALKEALGSASIPFGETVITRRLEYSLASRTGVQTRSFPMLLWRVGECVLLSLPAEVAAGYDCRLAAAAHPLHFIGLGLGADPVGYLPTAVQVREGGYEVECAANYGWDGPLDGDTLRGLEDYLVSAVKDVCQHTNAYA